MYRYAREIVSFLQSIQLDLNTLTLNSVPLSDTLISFYQHMLEFDINYLLKLLIRDIFYIRWHLHSIYVPSEAHHGFISSFRRER